MTTTTLIIVAIAIVVANVFAFLLLSRRSVPTQGEGVLKLLSDQMNDLRRTVDTKMGETNRQVYESLHTQSSASQKLLREISDQMNRSLIDVTKEQTKTNEATRQFVTIAEQLANLEKVLKHQKQRGNLGEASLELILSNMLSPEMYQMQYQFRNGDTVDAIIKTKEGFIPIDAKFSLDNYNRLIHAVDEQQRETLEKEFKNDLKKRIDETAKYVRPEEGTLPIAFMFIPAEGIYYDLLVNDVGGKTNVNARNLIDYAYNEKKVSVVSPTTFAAYLKSVLYGFKAFKIEEGARDILKKVDVLAKHWKSYEVYMQKLGSSLGTSVSHYNAAYKELGKVDKDVVKISGNAVGLEPLQLEKPSIEE